MARCSLPPDRTRYFAADSVRTDIMCTRAEERTGLGTAVMTEINDPEQDASVEIFDGSKKETL